MRYLIKKVIFFLFTLLSIPVLFGWILYSLDSALDIGYKLGIEMIPDALFRDDAIILPIFLSILFPMLGSLIYLIFYRRECSIWPKLLMLFAGISAFILPYLADDGHHPAIKMLLIAYAAIALTAIVWLIVAMVKYPKPESKTA